MSCNCFSAIPAHPAFVAGLAGLGCMTVPVLIFPAHRRTRSDVYCPGGSTKGTLDKIFERTGRADGLSTIASFFARNEFQQLGKIIAPRVHKGLHYRIQLQTSIRRMVLRSSPIPTTSFGLRTSIVFVRASSQIRTTASLSAAGSLSGVRNLDN